MRLLRNRRFLGLLLAAGFLGSILLTVLSLISPQSAPLATPGTATTTVTAMATSRTPSALEKLLQGECLVPPNPVFDSDTIFVFPGSSNDLGNPTDVWLSAPGLGVYRYDGISFGRAVDGSSSGGWQHPEGRQQAKGNPWLKAMGLEVSAPLAPTSDVKWFYPKLYAWWWFQKKGSCTAFELMLSTTAQDGAVLVPKWAWNNVQDTPTTPVDHILHIFAA